MDIERYVEEKRKKVDLFLETFFRKPRRVPKLAEAMHYSLLAGGKRIRPILTIASCEACGAPEGVVEGLALPVGCALEMIHTYSLIHDDLPAMDNDDLRRGRPTNHKVFGEATAILAGDALLTEAFALMASLQVDRQESLLTIIREIAQASGGEGMAGGQSLDLAAQGKKISPEELERLHRMKTGALIQVAVVSGAILAGATEGELTAIRDYGGAVGLAFQIADDILDVEGGTEQMGKNVGGDATKSKATYPSILGMDSAKRVAREWTEKAIAALIPFGSRADPLREISRHIIARRS